MTDSPNTPILNAYSPDDDDIDRLHDGPNFDRLTALESAAASLETALITIYATLSPDSANDLIDAIRENAADPESHTD
jgi:hypothetical protein